MTREEIVWFDGKFRPAEEAAVSPLDRGFLYGDGLFETIRAERGRLLYLDEHVARMAESARHFRLGGVAGTDWAGIAGQVLQLNRLERDLARVRLLVTRGPVRGPGLPPGRPARCVQAEPYETPTEAEYARGWRLHFFAGGVTPPLAAHKTLNYLYFQLARQAALDAGACDAVLPDRHGDVAETSTGALLCRLGDRWVAPASADHLPSITRRLVILLLAERGVPVATARLRPADLPACQTIWLLNSLVGIVPVAAIDSMVLPDPQPELAAELRQRLFAPPD